MSVICNICNKQINPMNRMAPESQYYIQSHKTKYGHICVQANVTISLDTNVQAGTKSNSLDLCDECALEQLEWLIKSERKKLQTDTIQEAAQMLFVEAG